MIIVEDSTTKHRKQNNNVHIVLFIVQKAFDSIWQDGLITKMDKKVYEKTIIRSI